MNHSYFITDKLSHLVTFSRNLLRILEIIIILKFQLLMEQMLFVSSTKRSRMVLIISKMILCTTSMTLLPLSLMNGTKLTTIVIQRDILLIVHLILKICLGPHFQTLFKLRGLDELSMCEHMNRLFKKYSIKFYWI